MYKKYLEQLNTETLIRNFTASTSETYQYYVGYFLKHVRKDPGSLTCADVREFILMRKQEGLSAATLNLYNASIRFFFRHVLHQPWDCEMVPRMKPDHHLPTVLAKEEIERLLSVIKNKKHKALLSTMYSSGLRVSEACRLHYDDISRSRRQVYVRESKSRCDRYTILSVRNIDMLTDYWYHCGRPTGILFPSRRQDQYLTGNSVNQCLKKYASEAGIRRSISPHALRHSFASHLLEAGVDRHYIQELLGHRDPRSTEAYLHVSNKSLMGVKSPFDMDGGHNG